MKKVFFWISGILLFLAIIIAGILLTLSSERFQHWLVEKGMGLLEARLKTELLTDSFYVNVQKGKLDFYGLQMNDLDHQSLIKIDTLELRFKAKALLNDSIVIKNVKMHGVNANLFKENKEDTPNFQFIVDALKRKNHKPGKGKKIAKTPHTIIVENIDIERFHVKWDIRKLPRINEGKPNLGAFDAHHFDLFLNLQASVHSITKDSLFANIRHLSLTDKGSGLIIPNLHTNVRASSLWISTDSLFINMEHTRINTTPIVVKLHKMPATSPISITKPFHLKADVVLQDLAAPFAPPLSSFTTPLRLDVDAGGDLTRINFNNILVTTPDGRLHLTAKGNICDVLKKHDIILHFNHIRLNAKNGIKEQIINHFAQKVRLKMVRQMKAVGNVRFHGNLDIPYKRVVIGGTIFTKLGNVNTKFTLNSYKYIMSGYFSTTNLHIGQLMNVEKLGVGQIKGNFTFDISAPKKGTKYHGRLPQGAITAHVSEVSYKGIKFKNVSVDIKSYGTKAEGVAKVPKKWFDIITNFTYTQTANEQKVEVKPSIRKHREKDASLDDEKARKEKKEQEKAEKAARKAEKKALKEKEKAEKAVQKEKEKAEKAARKEKEKAEKAEKKEKENAEKAALKEKKKEEKAARKAEKKALKEQKKKEKAAQK